MGIYNCASTLEAAVRSIQAQTYTDWELIMCDDGSTDDTLAVARKLAEEDGRIILLRNMMNRGLNYTLNKCLESATGEFIARQDGDDESVSTRFEKQVQFLQKQALRIGILRTKIILVEKIPLPDGFLIQVIIPISAVIRKIKSTIDPPYTDFFR